MRSLLAWLREILRRAAHDSLYRNAAYLLAATAVSAGLGFFFWLLNARLYAPADIGIATTLIAVLSFITQFSLFGFNIAIIRFLPTSKQPNDKLNTAFLATTALAIITSVLFLMFVERVSPSLIFLRDSVFAMLFFVVSMVAMTHFVFVESVFSALRRAEHVFIKNTVFSVLKLVLPVLLVGWGAFGIFGSWTIAGMLALIVSFVTLSTRFSFSPSWKWDKSVLRTMLPYSMGNYFEGFIASVPLLVIPVIITNQLGPETTAYYGIAMTFASFIFFLPYSVTQSMFAEGAHNQKKLPDMAAKARRVILVVLAPSVLVLILAAPLLLSFFGAEYAANATTFLRVMLASSLVLGYNSVYAMAMRIQNRVPTLVVMSTAFAAFTLIASIALLRYGLLGIAAAWWVGHVLVALVYTVMYRNGIAQPTRRARA